MKRILFFLVLILSFPLVKSQNYDNLRVSLLTVEPRDNEVYTIFGHTALRLSDPVQNIDIVFNWGTFDTQIPNFILRYVKGETDYFLSTLSFESFTATYLMYKNATVIEQELYFTDNQKENLIKTLGINLQPENSEYRYDFVFDNCTTRPRDIFEKICDGNLVYPKLPEPLTFRKLIHSCTNPYPWLEFGIDCVIGNGADSLISYRSTLFLPEKLMEAMNNSVVVYPDGSSNTLVLSSGVVVRPQDESQAKSFGYAISPVFAGTGLLLLFLVLIIVGYFKKRRFRLLFALLFLIAGTGGSIVATLCFFSLHPCTWPNWNILWLHPLHFIGCVGFSFGKSYRLFTWYHAINFVLLSGFMLGWYWIPQELNPAVVPYILSLWMISGYESFKKHE
ncbi:MAG: DUF4105 domain-containing protein [Dysgonamonadaceae bacterium]|nr:DUF4105 domain-containing protein [Dysgonamonadaceae bacterium]